LKVKGFRILFIVFNLYVVFTINFLKIGQSVCTLAEDSSQEQDFRKAVYSCVLLNPGGVPLRIAISTEAAPT
jgi:hypothetical protein